MGQPPVPSQATTTVGVGITIMVGTEPVTLQVPDIANFDPKKFKFKLAQPVEFPKLSELYNNLRASEFGQKLNLPAVDFNSGFAKQIGNIQATIQAFEINNEAGTLLFAADFKFDIEVLPGVLTLNTMSLVINRMPATPPPAT